MMTNQDKRRDRKAWSYENRVKMPGDGDMHSAGYIAGWNACREVEVAQKDAEIERLKFALYETERTANHRLRVEPDSLPWGYTLHTIKRALNPEKEKK